MVAVQEQRVSQQGITHKAFHLKHKFFSQPWILDRLPSREFAKWFNRDIRPPFFEVAFFSQPWILDRLPKPRACKTGIKRDIRPPFLRYAAFCNHDFVTILQNRGLAKWVNRHTFFSQSWISHHLQKPRACKMVPSRHHFRLLWSDAHLLPSV